MARISVYIPDELLEQARTARADPRSGIRPGPGSGSENENTSQLVQQGLHCLINSARSVPSYAQSPVGGQEQITQLRDRLLDEARHDYEVGYGVALEAASGMHLHVINSLVNANFDLRRWLEPYQNGFNFQVVQNSKPVDPAKFESLVLDKQTTPPDPDAWKSEPWGWLFKVAEALGNVADPVGYPEYSFAPTRARERGFVDAMRELWRKLEEPDTHMAPMDLVADQDLPPEGKRSRGRS
jgi:hypothetical protein